MGEGVAEAAERVKQRTRSVAARLTDTAAQTGEQARFAGRQVKDKANTLLHEQPMLMAGIGTALGAAIAALIPVTRTENRLMGETSDRMKRRVRDTAAQQFEAAKDLAGELVERAKTVAEREGVTTSVLRPKSFAGSVVMAVKNRPRLAERPIMAQRIEAGPKTPREVPDPRGCASGSLTPKMERTAKRTIQVAV